MRSTGRAKNMFDSLRVDGDLAGARLNPDAGDRVLALAGGIGAALACRASVRISGASGVAGLGAARS